MCFEINKVSLFLFGSQDVDVISRSPLRVAVSGPNVVDAGAFGILIYSDLAFRCTLGIVRDDRSDPLSEFALQ